ncbi:hypothetical protein WG66_005652 [Moniliophthora roreri]|nr:hypothetical protein WG66_005652 [Moniliophthora roreri]
MSTLTIYPTSATGLVGTTITTIGDRNSTNDSGLILYDIGNNVGAAYQIGLSPAMNSVLTFLTAGRIWWIHRQVRAHNIHTTSDKLIQSVSKIILESGSLYPILSIMGLVVRNTTDIPLDFFPLVALSAGIAPTLIIVRAKLGKNVESLQDQVSGIRFTSPSAPQEGTTTVSRAPVHSIGNFSMAAAEPEGGNEGRVADQKEATAV